MQLTWDGVGERLFETGVDRGVLYTPTNGVYNQGVAWNGLTAVTEAPSGAEATAVYADNIKYLTLMSTEEFGATIEAYTYPAAWTQHDGSVEPSPGIAVGQQSRRPFGLAYRTRMGNDVENSDYGYKLHLIYNALAAPSEKAYATINDSPEAITFSWELTTTPIPVTGLKPTAILTIDSTKVAPTALAQLEAALYGTQASNPRLPLPDEVIQMFSGSVTEVVPTQPSFTPASGAIVIPTVVGVKYLRTDTNTVVTDTVTIETPGDTLVIRAVPESGSYRFPTSVDDDWAFTRTL